MSLDEYMDIYDIELTRAFDEYIMNTSPELYHDDIMAEIHLDMYYEFCENMFFERYFLNEN